MSPPTVELARLNRHDDAERASAVAPTALDIHMPDAYAAEEGAESVSSRLLLGVTVAFMREYAQMAGCPPDCTTQDVHARVHNTAGTTLRSIAELSQEHRTADGHPSVGRAHMFVSHAHSRRWDRMLDAVSTYIQLCGLQERSTYVWFDLFCFRYSMLTSELRQVGDIEASIGHVVVVLDPWDNPVCLRRSWVLYEILHSLGPSVHLGLTMPAAEREAFVSALSRDPQRVEDTLTRFDVRTASASIESEQVALMSAIQQLYAEYDRLSSDEEDAPASDEPDDSLRYFNRDMRAAIRRAVSTFSWQI